MKNVLEQKLTRQKIELTKPSKLTRKKIELTKPSKLTRKRSNKLNRINMHVKDRIV